MTDQTKNRRAAGSAIACTVEQTLLGEGVRWDTRRDELLRVDILAGRVYRDRIDDDGSLVRVRTYTCPGPLARSLRSRVTRGGCSPPTGGSST